MTFRDTITTATDVDTRYDLTVPGFYTTGSRSGSATTGQALLSDGFSADADAGLVRTAQAGTAQTTSAYGGLAVKGGSYAGVTAPEWDLNVESTGPGATTRAARLKNVDVVSIPAGAQIQGDGVPLLAASKAARDALTKSVGLTVLRTDLGGLVQRWDGTAWRYRLSGKASGTTDANGILAFAHGSDQTPTAWGMQLPGQQTDSINLLLRVLAWAQDPTNLTLRAIRSDTNAWFPGNPTTVFWWAEF